jgi:hypothetical protein
MDGSIASVRTGLLAQVREGVDAQIDSRFRDMDIDARMRGRKRYDRGFKSWRLNELKAAARRVGMEVEG